MASLEHIGMAVDNIGAMTKLFSILGLTVSDAEEVKEQGVRAHFLPFSSDPGALKGHFEFLEVTDPQGTVAKFLEKRGPGIHHLAFAVGQGELDELCRRLTAEGYRLIYDSPRKGAHGMRINFIHPQSAGGILMEVMEPSEKR